MLDFRAVYTAAKVKTLRIFIVLAAALLGSCLNVGGGKYPQGLKEVLPDVYSRSFADVVTMRTLSELSGRDFLESSLLVTNRQLRPEAPLCQGTDLTEWRSDLNSCTVVEMVASEECRNRDGCAQLQLSEPLSSPAQLKQVFETLEQPCAYFPKRISPNYERVEFWQLPGLRNQMGLSSSKLGCLFRGIRPAVSAYDPTTKIVTLTF